MWIMALAIKIIIVSFVLLIVISSWDVSISYIPQTSDGFGGELQLFLVKKPCGKSVFSVWNLKIL
jgi:hypothetical protein